MRKTEEEILRDAMDRSSFQFLYTQSPALYSGIITAMQTFAQQDNWIDERKQKPPFETWVLCYCRIYGFYIGCYQQILDTGWGNWNDGKELGVLPPTHLQPLPSTPNSTPST